MGYVVMVFLLGIAIYLWWTGAVRVAEGYTNTRDVEYYVIHRDGHDAQIKNVNQNQQRLTSTPLYLFPAVETTDPAAVDPNLVYVPESFGQAPKDVATYLSHFAVMKKQYDDLRRPMPTHDASRHTVDAMMRVWDVSGLPVLDGSENQITLHPAFAGHTVILQDNANIVSRTDLDTQLQTLIQTLTANQESFDVLFLGSPSNAVPGVLPVAGTKDVYLCTGDTPPQRARLPRPPPEFADPVQGAGVHGRPAAEKIPKHGGVEPDTRSHRLPLPRGTAPRSGDVGVTT